jgi:hypothetical protein
MAHPPSPFINRVQASTGRDDRWSTVGERSRKYPASDFLIPPQAFHDLPLEVLIADLPLAEEEAE